MAANIILMCIFMCGFWFVSGENEPKVFCFYDTLRVSKYPDYQMSPTNLPPALEHCTHLVYGYAGVASDTFKISSNASVEYRAVTQLRLRYPHLKVLLSVGGEADRDDGGKYFELLKSSEARTAFINSAIVVVKDNEFDGIDLSWPFEKEKPEVYRTSLESAWHDFKKIFTGDSAEEVKKDTWKDDFSSLVRELNDALHHLEFMLTVSVLPNVDSELYFDPIVMEIVDYIILDGFDYFTPERNPKQADYSAPLYGLPNRNPNHNVHNLVTWWLSNNVSSHKLILGIPTYGRSWRMTLDSDVSGIPPLEVDGSSIEGSYSNETGLMSFAEICSKFKEPIDPSGLYLRQMGDPKNGVYAFRRPNEKGDNGIWISFEDPDTVRVKSAYARVKGLGGIALHDLTMDDFRGTCTDVKFPLLRSGVFGMNAPSNTSKSSP